MKNSLRTVGDIYEFSMTVRRRDPIKEEIIRNLFGAAGFSPEQCSESVLPKGPWRIAVYLSTKQQVQGITARLKKFPLKGVAVDCVRLRPSDWLEKWKTVIRPFNLTPHFRVVPTWSREQRSLSGKNVIHLNTTMAFGTGLHATTRMMARLIEECRGRFDSFLDVGTGTGILGILAVKCGAQRVVGIDIQAESIRTARENMVANQCRFELRQRGLQTFRSREQFDFVAANLYSEDLIVLREELIRRVRPGKYLAVSGIAWNHWTKCRRAFAGLPLKCRKVLKEKKWTAALYQRSAS